MAFNVRPAVNSYLGSLDTQDERSARSFTIRESTPRLRNNPSLDYTKVIIMVAAAIAVGYLYDQMRENSVSVL